MIDPLRTWQAVADEAEALVDLRGDPIDDGIKPLVIGLRCHGINTAFSCYGHSDRAYAAPWIDIIQRDLTDNMLEIIEKSHESLFDLMEDNSDIAELRKENYAVWGCMIDILDDFYKAHASSADERLVLTPWDEYGVFRLECQGSRLQEFRSEWERIERLKAYQSEMNHLASHLRTKIKA
jgi:hypothetical protein